MKIDSILILAAGIGSRLKPRTTTLPKCLMPLNDTNLLLNLIEQAIFFIPGVKIYINISYLGEKIIEEVLKIPVYLRPRLIWEMEPFGPAFSVTNFSQKNCGNTLVIHGDTYFSDQAFGNFTDKLSKLKSEASILLCHQKRFNQSRSIVCEDNGVITSISEIGPNQLAGSSDYQDNIVWSSSGIILVRENSLRQFVPEYRVGISPSLVNYIAKNHVMIMEKCIGERISVDDENSYQSAINLQQINEKLFNRTLAH